MQIAKIIPFLPRALAKTTKVINDISLKMNQIGIKIDSEKEHNFDDARVILVRHAKSEMNVKFNNFISKNATDYEIRDLVSCSK